MAWSYEILDARADAMMSDVRANAPESQRRALARHLRALLDELCQEAIAQAEAGTGDPATGDLLTETQAREESVNAVVFALEVARTRFGLSAATPRRRAK